MPKKLEVIDDRCVCGAEHMYTDIVEDVVYHICKVCGRVKTEGEKDGDV